MTSQQARRREKMKCDHKYVDMEDGTMDKFCVRCSKKFKQAAIHMPDIKVDINIEMKDSSDIADSFMEKMERVIYDAYRYDTKIQG